MTTTPKMNKSKGICLVDDEPDLMQIYSESLQEEYPTRSFSSAIVALDAIKQGWRPDVIVTDLRMPDLNGLQFLSELRSLGLSTSVIVASGNADKPAILEALSKGVSVFIEKPFTCKQLREVVQDAFITQNLLVQKEIEAAYLALLSNKLELVNDVYYERAARAENFIYSKSDHYFMAPEQRLELLKSLQEERRLNREIGDLKQVLRSRKV